MAVMAFWGQEQWEVSPAQVKALEGLSTSYTLKADANNDTSGTPPVNTTGKELQPVSFSWCVYDIAGVNVRNEISRWGSQVGEKNPLYIGAALLDQPSQEAGPQLAADAAWLIETYEPRVDVNETEVQAQLAQAGLFAVCGKVDGGR